VLTGRFGQMARLKLRHGLGVLALCAVCTVARIAGTLQPVAPTCDGSAPYVRVVSHTLALCEGARVHGVYRVRLGQNGMGKQSEGDGKTPSGTYELAAARSSGRFGTFVPIDYPNAQQRLRGYTGSAVGVHGPFRPVRFLGRWVNTFDSTDGCIGLASDREIDEIARWLAQHPAARISIE
jgi:L,D-peptidoglycan transpeptidase YkuD (ErfK/YbiS/YcfS/YnhG family)